MKNVLARVDKFMDDHRETLVTAAIASSITATVMYFAAVKDWRSVRTVDALAKITTDEKLHVKVALSNGSWSIYTWDTLPVQK
jgi:hypothetical protein